jgi:hypothetical protein
MNELNHRPIRPWLYWVIVYAWVAIILVSAGIIYGWGQTSIEDLSVTRQVLLGLLVLWVIYSIKIVRFDQVIGLLGLEMPIKDKVGPGPKLIPWPLIRTITYPSNVQQKQFPGDPEVVFKGDDKEALPEGMVRPLRVTTGKPADDQKGILDIQASVEVLFYLRLRIQEPLRFYLKYNTVEGFWVQIRDTGQKFLAKTVSQTKGLGELMAKLPEIMESLHSEFVNVATEGGVEIIESGLDSPDLSKRLAEAMRDLGVARSLAQQEAVKITAEGAARAEAERMLIEETQKALVNAGEAAQAAYIGARVLGDKTMILGTEGIAQAVGVLGHIMKGTK